MSLLLSVCDRCNRFIPTIQLETHRLYCHGKSVTNDIPISLHPSLQSQNNHTPSTSSLFSPISKQDFLSPTNSSTINSPTGFLWPLLRLPFLPIFLQLRPQTNYLPFHDPPVNYTTVLTSLPPMIPTLFILSRIQPTMFLISILLFVPLMMTMMIIPQ
jgi:hypothetical protein